MTLNIQLQEVPGSDCPSCEDLWRDYRSAMIAHLAAVDELGLAQFLRDVRKSFQCEGVVSRAERTRELARGAAMSHEKSHRRRMAA